MKAKDFVVLFANDIKRELLRRNSALKSAEDNWGIAATGKHVQSISPNLTSYGDIDISHLGFTSTDDYIITGHLTGTHSQWGTWGIDESQTTASNIRVGIFCTESTTLTLNYVIIGKGFGGDSRSSDWGVAKVAQDRMDEVQSIPGWYEATIDVTDLGFANADDYTVQFSVVGGDNDWGAVGDNHVASKTTSDFSIKCSYAGEGTAPSYIDVEYTIIAKGYGNVPNGTGGGGINFEVGAEKWYGTYTENGVTYQVYSKIVYIPALPAEAGITNVPHGVTGIKQILAVQGFCSNSMIMNAPRQNVQDNISIYQVQKSGNIAIEVGKDRSSVSAYVTIIYAKNNS